MAVVNMVRCPMCNKEWIDGDYDLVCTNCSPDMEVDMAVADIQAAISILNSISSSHIKKRLVMLASLRDDLHVIVESLK